MQIFTSGPRSTPTVTQWKAKVHEDLDVLIDINVCSYCIYEF